MTLMEIVNQLLNTGNIVSYRVRSDGGIIITSINGQKYKGAEGNAQARRMVGATLSTARASQLAEIRPPKGVSPKKRKKAPIRKEILDLTRKVQRKWKQNVDPSKGKITRRKVRWTIEHLGEEEALKRLRQAYRYALGLAYDSNIDSLLGYIYEVASKLGNQAPSLYELADYIDNHRADFKEEWISPIYDALYEINHGVPVEEVIRRIETIIHGSIDTEKQAKKYLKTTKEILGR